MRQIRAKLHDLSSIALSAILQHKILNMKKDAIIQFVCFVTTLGEDEFAPQWEKFAKKLKRNSDPDLQQQTSATKNRFRFISRHEWTEQDIQFSFMNNKRAEHFPEHSVRVVQIGGYIPFLIKKKNNIEEDGFVKLMAFIGHNENDIDFYSQLPQARHSNIYQAFYENCTYGYVMEFFIAEKESAELLALLKQRSGVDVGIYKECLVPQD